MSSPPFPFDFEVDRKSGSIDFDLSLRAFEVETRSFLESEKDPIRGLTSMLQVREAIELPYRMIPGLTYGPASVVKVPWVEIVPNGPYDVIFKGSLEGIIFTISTYQHEHYHLFQIFHESVFDKYILSERAIDRFRKMIRDLKDEKILKKLIKLTEAGIEFKLEEEDKSRLLEAVNVETQMGCIIFGAPIEIDASMYIWKIIPEIRSQTNIRLFRKFLECVLDSNYHKNVLEFLINFRLLAQKDRKKLYLQDILLVYTSLFSDLGASDILILFEKIKNEPKILEELPSKIYIEERAKNIKEALINNKEALKNMILINLKEFDVVVDRIGELPGRVQNFGTYKENLLRKFYDNNLPEKLEGFSKARVKLLKEIIERHKQPSQLFDEMWKLSCIIFKDQKSILYVYVPHDADPEYAQTTLSFYSDLYICTSILKAAEEAFRKGKDPWKAMERAVMCPYRYAPQMGCREKSECEHEKPWLDAVVER
jgi:hypothetical protein